MAHPSPLTQILAGIASKLIKESEEPIFVKKKVSLDSMYCLFYGEESCTAADRAEYYILLTYTSI
jgi:hypothetical protein